MCQQQSSSSAACCPPSSDCELPPTSHSQPFPPLSCRIGSNQRLKDVNHRRRTTGKRKMTIREAQLNHGSSLVALGFVILAVLKCNTQPMKRNNLDLKQQSENIGNVSYLRDVSPAIFTWLLVDAFGLSPAKTALIRPVTDVQCHRKWGKVSECYSSYLFHNSGPVWGRRKVQQQSQRCHLSSGLVVCKSTINGQVSETELTDGAIETESLVDAALLNGRTANGRVNGANGVNGPGHSKSINGSHDDQLTSLVINGDVKDKNGEHLNGKTQPISELQTINNTQITTTLSNFSTANLTSINGDTSTQTDQLSQLDIPDVPQPTAAGGFTHTTASRAKISAANKGKTPWNKGKSRSEETRARIAEGVRRRNRERFLAKLAEEGITEEEYEQRKKEKRRKADAERRARRTEKGGYKPTEETKQKISSILKEKYANGEIKRKPRDPSTIRRGFKHSEETKAKIASTLRRKWAEDEEYRDYMTNRTIANDDIRNSKSVRTRISETLKKKWEDPEFRSTMMEKFANRTKNTSSTKAKEHRQKISEAMKRKWMDEEYRQRATKGMAKSKTAAGPKLVSPKQPKGKVVRKANPLKKKSKKKKKSVKKKSKKSTDGDKISTLLEMEPISAAATARAISSEPTVEEELEEGSIERLRKERKDLYDLLYGDDDEIESAVVEFPTIEKDTSFTSMLLDGPYGSGPYGNNNVNARTVKESKPVYANNNGLGGGGKLASLLAEDGDLDDFDPYGLEDF